MDRFYKYLLIVSTLGLSWLGMMAVHELGHCLHAWISGGAVAKVVLHPLALSRTDLCRNPHPLFVAWGGAVIGVLLPVVVLIVAKMKSFSVFYLFQFFAGFCLIVNGIYIAEDTFFMSADGRDLIRYGTPPWIMLSFGIGAVALGIALWNGLGPYFGFGKGQRGVSRRIAVGAFSILLMAIVAEFVIGSW